MVLKYIPLDIHKCCKELNLKNSNTVNKEIYEKFINYFDNNFCKFILQHGKNKENLCGRLSKYGEYCGLHKNCNNDKKTKKEYFYCISKSIRNNRCKRKVKKEGELCKYHNNKNVIFVKNNISLFFIFINNIIIITIIITFIILLFSSKLKEKDKNKIVGFNNIKKLKIKDIIDYIDVDYKKEGNNQIRIKNDKFNIVLRNNKYYDNRNGVYGVGVIDFYIYIKKVDLNMTIKRLADIYLLIQKNKEKNIGNKIIMPTQKINKINNKNLMVSRTNDLPIIKTDNIKYVIEYLHDKRNISMKTIKYLINKNYLSSDNNRNCVFYNEDKTYAFLRSTYSNFKKHTGQSNFIILKNDKNPLYLFESVIDMISYIDMLDGMVRGIFACTGGNMMINKVEELINKDINEVIYCFDNDTQGNYIMNTIKDILKKYNLKNKIILPNEKDWNDELKKIKTVKQ